MKITETSKLSCAEWSKIIDNWIFNEKHRSILKRRLLDGVKIEKLSEEFDLSVDGIKKIISKNMPTLKNHIKDKDT
ncbi:MAG: hypothetical protein K2G04_05620 [Oscillospiraceae bacterium]|nr:hypothetical protein [Oscillospiraceae bacterium]